MSKNRSFTKGDTAQIPPCSEAANLLAYGDPYIDLVYSSNLISSHDEYYTYYLLLKYYFENNIPTDFWPIVNFYSVIKAIIIMESEAKMNPDGKPLLSIEGLMKQHCRFTEEQPLWHARMHKLISVDSKEDD